MRSCKSPRMGQGFGGRDLGEEDHPARAAKRIASAPWRRNLAPSGLRPRVQRPGRAAERMLRWLMLPSRTSFERNGQH
jgi:hypothetical protein